MNRTDDEAVQSRRLALKLLGGLTLGLGLARCGTGLDGADAGAGGGSASGAGGGSAAGGGTAATGGGTAVDAGDVAWATGDGTFLSGKSYGNPFSAGVGSTCTVYKASTAGPCHSNTYDRQEVTEGYIGLPMRLELIVVDQNCAVVPNATVEIWHASPGGLYSGAKVNGAVGSDLNVGFCTDNDAAALAAGWFRGYQTSGADGRVTFDTLFPGWYSGRAWHIHFKVSVGSTQYITSQLFADETLKNEIFSTHASYDTRPTTSQGYVTNATDMVVTQSSLVLSDVVLETAKQSDGAMLAWKAITVTT